MTTAPPTSSKDKRHLPIAFGAAAVAVGMVGMAYAAVPLYEIFCSVTGFGGTTQQAEAAPGNVLDATVDVRFDANIGNGLGWSFRPQTREVELKIGEVGQINYIAANRSSKVTTGTAAFNVTPASVGAYFNKISCFCFTEQTLQPGESVEMPVVFFVDPAFADDPDLENIRTITLSYTFFPTEPSAQPGSVAGVRNDAAPSAL